jgi:hypothetical protein
MSAANPAYIERKHGNTSVVTNKALNNEEFLMLEYATKSYSFVLPFNGRFSFGEWAEEIKKTCDENEPHNKQVLFYILKLA